MSSPSRGQRIVTISVVMLTLAVVGWAKREWLKLWWTAINDARKAD